MYLYILVYFLFILQTIDELSNLVPQNTNPIQLHAIQANHFE